MPSGGVHPISFHIAPDSDSGLTMSRYDLTDFEWRVIEPLLPNKSRGVPRVDDRACASNRVGARHGDQMGAIAQQWFHLLDY
jgi:hypothetical protein